MENSSHLGLLLMAKSHGKVVWQTSAGWNMHAPCHHEMRKVDVYWIYTPHPVIVANEGQKFYVGDSLLPKNVVSCHPGGDNFHRWGVG